MGWFGDTWNSAWNAASGAAKKTASAVANGVNSAKDWTAEKAGQVKDWAVEKGTQAKDWAVDKATQAKDWTVDKATQAKDWTVEKATQAKDWAVEKGTAAARGAEQGIAKGALWAAGGINRGVNAAGNAYDSAAQKAKDAYNKARDFFGLEPVGNACPECEGKKEPTTDGEADGWYMGEGCKPKKTLAEAKAAPVKPSANNKCCEGKSGQKTIYYVNGIQTDRAAHCNTLNEIANSTCANVIGIYNATAGSGLGFVGDGLQTGGDRALINAAANGKPVALDGRNPAVNTVSDTIYSEVMAGNKPEIWAHSQGGAVTSLGLYSANNRLDAAGNPNGLQGVNVTSMGSAAPQWVQGPNYDHYVNTNDLTPVSLGLGSDPAKAAARGNGNVHLFSKDGNTFHDVGTPGYSKGVLTATSNHGVEETYIAKRDQDKGGCGQSFKSQ